MTLYSISYLLKFRGARKESLIINLCTDLVGKPRPGLAYKWPLLLLLHLPLIQKIQLPMVWSSEAQPKGAPDILCAYVLTLNLNSVRGTPWPINTNPSPPMAVFPRGKGGPAPHPHPELSSLLHPCPFQQLKRQQR